MSKVLRQISYEQAKQLRELDLPVCGTDTSSEGDFDGEALKWEEYVSARCKDHGSIGDMYHPLLRHFTLVEESDEDN